MIKGVLTKPPHNHHTPKVNLAKLMKGKLKPT